jgi:hypothetical protein
MPVIPTSISSPDDQDERVEPVAPDPVNTIEDPAHPMWLEEYIWVPGVEDYIYDVANFLAEERDIGYAIFPSQWPDEPAEDSRDWGPWARHGSLIYDLYED